ncbi:CapA family protein [Pseudoalteromonas fenneropenaei]|uniref:CapA family protein n=1 Tax=Pseudoalteromonas fenneropenaei TaxID=1737459 RepID=A0ABV7CL84_9GAMM
MGKIKVARLIAIIPIILLYAGCGGGEPQTTSPITPEQEQQLSARERFLQQSAPLALHIKRADGSALSDIQVNIAGDIYHSDSNGLITTRSLALGNYLLKLSGASIFTSFSVVSHQGLTSAQAIIATVAPNTAHQSLFFAGDTMFGRRFMDPSLLTMSAFVPDVLGALIRPTSAANDAMNITQYVADLVQSSDFSSVNLETAVTANPTTPHPSKQYVLFSLPDTLQGLSKIGVDYVALGNNHVYDYLDAGLNDTLAAVNAAGLYHSGAEQDLSSALAASIVQIPQLRLGLISATSILGQEHQQTYVATDNKSGAADLTASTALDSAIKAMQQQSDFQIVQMHGGDEYSYAPTEFISNRFEFVSKRGVSLAMAHHPHVAQGFATFNGVPALLGLGNFVFDQDRLETMLGVAVVVHVDPLTQQVYNALAYPLYIEDSAPKLLAEPLASRLLKRLAQYSDDNVTVIPRGSYAEVYFRAQQAQVSTQTVSINLPAGEHILDLRRYAPPSAFLSALTSSNAESKLTLGQDVLYFGDFDDWDNDDERLEASRWSYNHEDIYPCFTAAHRGQQGMCLSRSKFDNTPIALSFRHTIRPMPVTPSVKVDAIYPDMTLFGYLKAINAGRVLAEINYVYTSSEVEPANFEGDAIRREEQQIYAGGSTDWQSFALPIKPESKLEATKLTFRHFPALSGDALLALDDIAAISWQQQLTLQNFNWQQQKPHGLEFLRVNTASSATFELTFSTLN